MTKTNLKLVLVAVLVAITVSTSSYFVLLSRSDVEKTDINNILNILVRPDDQEFGWQYPVTKFPDVGPITGQIAYSTIRDPGGIPQGLPVRLKIPDISVDSAIEDALITPDGRMDVPYGSVNVAWFSLGPKPGYEGSAVIGGHFGINDGVKFVFYELEKLKIGDRIYIVDDNGKTLAFQVRKIELFERNADATTVFTSDDGLAHLNLITCEGIWNRINDTYPLRRVIFTDAISAEGAAEGAAKADAESVFPDVDPNAYYADGVSSMPYKGLMKGYLNGDFGPNDPVTRGQLATILKRYDDRLLYNGGGGLYGSLKDMRAILCNGISEEDFNSSSTEAVSIFKAFCTDDI